MNIEHRYSRVDSVLPRQIQAGQGQGILHGSSVDPGPLVLRRPRLKECRHWNQGLNDKLFRVLKIGQEIFWRIPKKTSDKKNLKLK